MCWNIDIYVCIILEHIHNKYNIIQNRTLKKLMFFKHLQLKYVSGLPSIWKRYCTGYTWHHTHINCSPALHIGPNNLNTKHMRHIDYLSSLCTLENALSLCIVRTCTFLAPKQKNLFLERHCPVSTVTFKFKTCLIMPDTCLKATIKQSWANNAD